MNLKYKTSWVKALRSGKFEQGVKALNRGDKYCCLGVLCQIAGVPSVEHEGTRYFDNDRITLSVSLRKEFGLTDDSLRCYLIHMNDSKGKSFDEIADWIEVNL